MKGAAVGVLLGIAASTGCLSERPLERPPDVLVVALSDDPVHLNPAITTQGGVHTASTMLYNGLVGLTAELEPVPELATTWDIEDGGRLYRFHLRDDVVWHDGTPFTSADVSFTIAEILLRYHARARASLGTVLERVDTPDAHTVELRFRAPYAPLLQQLNVHEAPILPRHVFEGTDPLTNPANRSPVGTGPFRFDEHRPDVEIRYVANPDYFKPGLPRLERIVMRVIPDAGNQVLSLEAGEVDWLFGVPGPQRPRLERRGFEFLSSGLGSGGSNCIMTLSYNLDRPAFADVRTRRAIAHGIDRGRILERILFGEGRVADAPISSGIPFAHAQGLPLPTHDVAEARRLLEEAGWRSAGEGRARRARGVSGVEDGTALVIEFSHFPTYADYARLLRAQLATIGVEFVSRPLEPAVFSDVVFGQRDFDMNIISYCNMTDPEVGVRRMYVSSNIAPVPFSNSSAYRNPVVDSLFDRGRSVVDEIARGRAYRRIQEILVRDLPYMWLVETVSTRAHSPRCEGFSVYGHFAERASCDE